MNNLETVRELYEAFEEKDAERVRAVLHRDVEWIQCAGFPGGDHRRGADAVIDKVFGGLRSEWEGFSAPIDEFVDGGRTVVVLGKYVGRHRETGRDMTAVFAHVYEVDDGRITRFRQYTDTAEMVRAMGSGP
ncbi:MAG: nuclear transport factor 2 family protein [Planctomycetota bacterium]